MSQLGEVRRHVRDFCPAGGRIRPGSQTFEQAIGATRTAEIVRQLTKKYGQKPQEADEVWECRNTLTGVVTYKGSYLEWHMDVLEVE